MVNVEERDEERGREMKRVVQSLTWLVGKTTKWHEDQMIVGKEESELCASVIQPPRQTFSSIDCQQLLCHSSFHLSLCFQQLEPWLSWQFVPPWPSHSTCPWPFVQQDSYQVQVIVTFKWMWILKSYFPSRDQVWKYPGWNQGRKV